jgi:hypothetical protein
MGPAWYERMLITVGDQLSRVAVWHRWPFPFAMVILLADRTKLRWNNLFDTQRAPLRPAAPDHDFRAERSADGSYNDLASPWMGMAGARFGRNMPLDRTFGEVPPGLYEPNPRRVSNELLARRDFVPVPHLNVMVAAWLQFMVHDWLSHGVSDTDDPPHALPLPPGDDWPRSPMTVLRSRADQPLSTDQGLPATYTNVESHWWDASQIYGSSLARQRLVRTDPQTGELCPDGKIGLTPDGHLPTEGDVTESADAEGARFPALELAGVNGNWWIGLSAMHTLFAREHNAVIDRLKADFPAASGEWLFQKARLVVSALLAKIHTTEWTPALMNSPEGRFVMRANWWGVLGEHYERGYGRLSDTEVVSGIMGSPTNQHAAPYAMTEEFVACYRMHPLMPDVFSFRSHRDDKEMLSVPLLRAAHGNVQKIHAQVPFEDLIYSLATSHPGALVLHNYPNQLRKIPEKPAEGIYTDLAAVDILRDRERGVPRYCEFRRQLGMPAPKNFEGLTTDPQWRAEIKAVYPRVEDVDLLVGTLAESKASPNGTPPGFGFSDTVFRVFILMASRRLKSDRFFTSDFTPATYTQAGWDWIEANSFRTVLTRHCPALAPLFENARNVFFPWSAGGG